MVFYGLKTCDTCRKAEKALRDKGISLRTVDVRSDGVPRSELERFFAEFGQDLINRRSTTWRTLSESERQGDPIDLLLAHPTLMKRPVVDRDGALFLGWGADQQAKLLG